MKLEIRLFGEVSDNDLIIASAFIVDQEELARILVPELPRLDQVVTTAFRGLIVHDEQVGVKERVDR